MTEASTPDNDTLVLADIGDGGILRLTLNAPKSRNALSEAMMSALSVSYTHLTLPTNREV